MTDYDDRAFRTVMGQFCTGVVVATGCLNDEPVGFSAQSFFSVSLEPPMVGLCPAKTSTSWPKIRDSGSFCINVLNAHQKSLCDVFARSGANKFDDIQWRSGITGSPVLDGVLAYLDCDIDAEHDAGDHTIVVGRVRDIAILDENRPPLLFLRGEYGQFEDLK